MESISDMNREIILSILKQAHDGIVQLQEWTNGVNILDLPKSPNGVQLLAGNCMLLQAICESIKQINKRSNKILEHCPEIPWRHIMSMRDRIAHGYFDIDIEYVDQIVREDLEPLKQAVETLINLLPTLPEEEFMQK